MADTLLTGWFGILAVLMFGVWLGFMYHQLLTLPLHVKLLRLLKKEQPDIYRGLFLFSPPHFLPHFGIFKHAKFAAFLKTGHPELSPQAENIRLAYKARWEMVWKYFRYFFVLWGVGFVSILLAAIGFFAFSR